MGRGSNSIRERKIESGNPAKASRRSKNDTSNRRTTSRSGNGRRTRVKKANTPGHKKVGVVLASLLLVTILVFLYSVFKLNMLPLEYSVIIMAALVVVWLMLVANQLLARKRATIGKCICVLLTICLSTASFYLVKTNNMLASITNNSGLKIDEMAVVVLVDDVAETLEDVKKYNFGVQYALQGEDVEEAVDHINGELGTRISTVEYNNVGEQAQALLDGEVSALIYNEAYSTIIEEEIPEYPNLIKVVYSYEIHTELEEEIKDIDITREPFSVYISGIDVFGSIGKSSRSDVNIIMYVNPVTRQILLVNTPRDYYVTFPGVTGSSKDKLTHAGIYGVKTSMNTMESIYGISMDYYARVNFTSLINIVDALGGINVYSELSFTSLGNIYFPQGYITMDGALALAFSRERYNLPGGDNQRGKNQQAVISAMIEKATSPAIITGATKIISSVSGSVDTDMPQADIQELIKSQLKDTGSWNVKSMAATGTGDSQYCYSYTGKALYVMQPNQSSINNIKGVIEKLYNGEIITESMVAQ